MEKINYAERSAFLEEILNTKLKEKLCHECGIAQVTIAPRNVPKRYSNNLRNHII
ncbi:hypothetical protein ALC57_03977 [Trachymyrmex cornetzi]|uniref:Uncharacterized protein n=1 Tax=Trachymyrmex cornetzi TaxID=471704 RepID=A0A151JLL4_9HYME|nr:hypothetical protein ALC57_03977 [Trachymyrmex cornetzi]